MIILKRCCLNNLFSDLSSPIFTINFVHSIKPHMEESKNNFKFKNNLEMEKYKFYLPDGKEVKIGDFIDAENVVNHGNRLAVVKAHCYVSHDNLDLLLETGILTKKKETVEPLKPKADSMADNIFKPYEEIMDEFDERLTDLEEAVTDLGDTIAELKKRLNVR